jgi:hypothetical protein
MPSKTRKRKIKTVINAAYCNAEMTFGDCMMEVVRNAAIFSEKKMRNGVDMEAISKLMNIVEEFLVKKRLVCYGGTAINNILPKSAQFYDRATVVPDYDFYSTNPVADAKELADIYFEKGYINTEAKAGVHYGTYKVFVDFIPVADITLLHKELFNVLQKTAIMVRGILYCPPNYLRMNMHLELSRPAGDVSRWEKVAARLELLNKHHPLEKPAACAISKDSKKEHNSAKAKIQEIIRGVFIDDEAVFIGGFALDFFDTKLKMKPSTEILDVLHTSPEKCAMMATEKLSAKGIKGATVSHHEAVGETIPRCCVISVMNQPCAYIYEPVACHGYNEIHIDDTIVRIASIDTMMTFFLAFYYTSTNSAFCNRVMCMAHRIYELAVSHIEDTGILKRFDTECYGTQSNLNDIRKMKADKFDELKNKGKTDKVYESWFLKYTPKGAKTAPETEPDSQMYNNHARPRTYNRTRKMRPRRRRRSHKPRR